MRASRRCWSCTGRRTPRVPYSSALAIVARAAEVGIPAEFHSLEGIGHVVWTPYKEDIILWMANFLYVHVIDPPPVGGMAEHPQIEPDAATSGGGASTAIAIGGTVTVGALLLAAGAWGMRRRRAG